MKELSILTPPGREVSYKIISDITMHDLALDVICSKISKNNNEKEIIRRFMANVTDDPEVTKFRTDVFEDLMNYPKMRARMLELLDRIDFLKSYGSLKTNYEEANGAWDLLHRLAEINDYIKCVEAMYECLSENDIRSEGLKNIKEYVAELFDDKGFAEMKEDIRRLKADTSNLKSVTIGVNLNDRLEAEGIGIISINSKPFTKAGILSSLSDRFSGKDHINPTEEWDGDSKYHPATAAEIISLKNVTKVAKISLLQAHPLLGFSLAQAPEADITENAMEYMDKVASQMISLSVKKLKDILLKYVSVSIRDISNLIPEFIYYIRWAEYIESLEKAGVKFCKPHVADSEGKIKDRFMNARGIFNLKLLELAANNMDEITTNDLQFDEEKRVYILTGANRGGKTTITQAIGQLYVLAQGGIYIPGEEFEFSPVDGIFTHFPADEDKTMDLGRLGEECQRFKELFSACTKTSLLLLNETFSTTSFEEGYYIAYDAVKAILGKGVRTIYNTHMHKLGYEVDSINQVNGDGKAASLIVKAEDGKRTYKVEVAPPVGISFARDIAMKYGVTYEQLTQ